MTWLLLAELKEVRRLPGPTPQASKTIDWFELDVVLEHFWVLGLASSCFKQVHQQPYQEAL